MSDRLALGMERVGITVARLVFALNQSRVEAGEEPIASQTFRNWARGDREPSLADIARLAKVIQCDPGWLAFGDQSAAGPPEWWPKESRLSATESARVAGSARVMARERQSAPKKRKA